MSPDGTTLARAVPPERWPFCYPGDHQECCTLHAGGLFCDCTASDEDDLTETLGQPIAETRAASSQVSQKSGCQQTRFYCKPP